MTLLTLRQQGSNMAALVLSLLYCLPSICLPIMPIEDEAFHWHIRKITQSMPDCIDSADNAHR